MLDPFEPCFIYNDNIDDYDEQPSIYRVELNE